MTITSNGAPDSISPALNSINERMHQALREVVMNERQKLGPLIMFEDGKIKFYRGDEEVESYSIIPPLAYDQLKIIGHAAFLIVIQMQRSDLTSSQLETWCDEFIGELYQVRKELPNFDLPGVLTELQLNLIDKVLDFTKKAKQEKRMNDMELRVFSKEIMPLLQSGFTHSAKLHLDLIHEQGLKLYAIMTAEEREHFRGYFHGGRGAREGNLALQYISWLVGERSGQESERVIFTENILDRDQAMMQLAKFSIERELADLVFGDPSGLHRDVLSGATREYLRTFPDIDEVWGRGNASN